MFNLQDPLSYGIQEDQELLNNQRQQLLQEKDQLTNQLAMLSDRLATINGELGQCDIKQSKLDYLYSEFQANRKQYESLTDGLKAYRGMSYE